MLTLSPSAVAVVDELLHQPSVPDDAGLRIHPAGDRQLAVEIAAEPEPQDQVIEQGGARVFVDPAVAPLLDDAQLHAQNDGERVAFGVTPNAESNGTSPR